MYPNSLFHNFPMHSRAFLARATEQLELFELRGDVTAFFHAALHLRFGIEARLNEYIRAALESLGRPTDAWSEYIATDLLSRLKRLNPNADQKSFLISKQIGTAEPVFEAQYTPVSQRLAKIHGQLGEILHHKFFLKNPNWYVKASLASNSQKSLVDHADLLKEGLKELRKATSGTLLATPFFNQLIEEIIHEQRDSPSKKDKK